MDLKENAPKISDLNQSLSTLLKTTIEIEKSSLHNRKNSGEQFNIFNTLQLESSEGKLHSTFLGLLLDPNGSHGQGNLFLDQFLNLVDFTEYDTASSKSKLEKHIGFLETDYDGGGRIDLVLENMYKQAILIENKIYAADQPKQLKRYYDHAAKTYPSNSFKLIYLTLNGSEPSSDSKCDLQSPHYKCLSYSFHIISWLEYCIPLIQETAFVKETICQYVNSLKSLTGQTSNDRMTKEIADFIVSNPENIRAAYLIRNNTEIFKHLQFDLLKKLITVVRSIAARNNLHFLSDPDFGTAPHDTYLRIAGPKNISVFLGFEKYTQEFMIGVGLTEQGVLIGTLREHFSFSNLDSEIGPNEAGGTKDWYYLHHYRQGDLGNWHTGDVWVALQNESIFPEIDKCIQACVNKLASAP